MSPSVDAERHIPPCPVHAFSVAFALLAPFAWLPDRLESALNTAPAIAVAMGLKGVGSALSNAAVYPDLVVGLDKSNAAVQATVAGLWNAAYAVGWAAGPLIGGLLYSTFQVNELCLGELALPPFCPSSEGSWPYRGFKRSCSYCKRFV